MVVFVVEVGAPRQGVDCYALDPFEPQVPLSFVEIGHDIFPTTTVESSRLVLSRSAPRVPERALSMGRDNRLVLETILGYSAERIDTLLDSEVMC